MMSSGRRAAGRRPGVVGPSVWVAAVLSAVWALPCRGGEAAGEARAVVRHTSQAVIAVLRDASLSSAAKREQVEKIVYENVDFDTMSRLVLARNRRRFSKVQRAEFVREFKRHLSRTYGDSVDKYKNEAVAITGDRAEARGDWTVQTRIVRDGPDDVRVDYRLRKKSGRWWIIDVIIERVSLVSNFRSQFKGIVADGGPEKLLRLLREKNARKAEVSNP